MSELTFPRMVYSDRLAPQHVEYGWGCKVCNSAEEWSTMIKQGWVLHPDDLKNEAPSQFTPETELDKIPAVKKAGRPKKAA